MRGARRLIAVIAARALPLLLVLAATHPVFAGILAVGDPVVELDTAQDDSGKSFKLKQVSGWRVLTIGADWCKPCHKELKAWDELAGNNGKVTFITVAIDNDVKDGKRLHKDLKIKHMKRVYMPADKTAVAERYGSAVMPTTFVIDPEGRVRHVHKGYDPGDEDKLKKALAKLVK